MKNDIKTYIIDCPELMREWNWEKNNELGLDPNKITLGSGKRAWWICNKGHEWEATVDNRANGTGCRECGKIKRVNSKRKTIIMKQGSFAEQYPELLKEWDYTKNTISPFDITRASHEQVWWTCFVGHSWQDSIAHRTIEHRGCPVCSSESKTSFPEQAIYFYFKQVTDTKNKEIINGKEIDIYLKNFCVGIEYNGSYWHKNRKENDLDKITFFKSIGIDIIAVTDGNENKIENNCIRYKKDLNFVIRSLFDMLHITPPSIDVDRDRYKIYEQYVQLKKENSLAKKYPDIALEWHPTKNGNLTPDMFDYSSNKSAWWLCSQCGHEWEDTINHRTSKGHTKCAQCSRKEGGKKISGKNSCRAKPVVQCDLKNNFIKIWDCAADVERILGIRHSYIAECCAGKRRRKTAGGYKWYYLYDKIDNGTIILGAISLHIVSEKDVEKYINYNIGDNNGI